MDDCIFCKIINRELPSTVVYEDDRVMAFKDINPEAPVHVLIVPKEHIKDLNDVDSGSAGYIVDIHMAAKKIAQKLGIAESGYRLINNCGEDGGQTVFHIHYHLVGGRKLSTKIL
ncbi:histidine triad (HIT) family protein [Anaerobacterium chartisolvens]|uniref:Histidine triad (HIT) family protein n=1 Tax=Anaerobacterium chartisolvens TaxID=1297424 RepID=A0A369B026_9FIRM|nr:histidine triad nucleotide-binding protein [Anaerobacterium chartisolvens]RCX13786.1 histidine triad (HIT) family protein [Anaerobacterium chartisolvens]